MYSAIEVDQLPDQRLAALDFLCGMGFDRGGTGIRLQMRNPVPSSEFTDNQGQQDTECHGQNERGDGQNRWLSEDVAREFHRRMPSFQMSRVADRPTAGFWIMNYDSLKASGSFVALSRLT
jgi:hypothetical protein